MWSAGRKVAIASTGLGRSRRRRYHTRCRRNLVRRCHRRGNGNDYAPERLRGCYQPQSPRGLVALSVDVRGLEMLFLCPGQPLVSRREKQVRAPATQSAGPPGCDCSQREKPSHSDATSSTGEVGWTIVSSRASVNMLILQDVHVRWHVVGVLLSVRRMALSHVNFPFGKTPDGGPMTSLRRLPDCTARDDMIQRQLKRQRSTMGLNNPVSSIVPEYSNMISRCCMTAAPSEMSRER